MNIVGPSRSIRTALFPVSALGTRFLPATKAMPKELFPIVDKPLIQYAVEEAVAAGIEHIVLITHRTKRAIEDHFDAASELEHLLELQGKHALLYELRATCPPRFSLSCVRHHQQGLGLGHALLSARHLVGSEPFAVLLPDHLMRAHQPVLAQMIQQYPRLGGSMVAVEPITPGDPASNTDLVEAAFAGERTARVARVADARKPATPTDPVSAVVGRYLLSPAIFDALAESASEPHQELHLVDGIRRLLLREAVFAFRFEGQRFDCGSKLGFLEATVSFGLQHPDVGEAFASMLGRLAHLPAQHASGSVPERERTAPVASI